MKSGFIYNGENKYQFEYDKNYLSISVYGRECKGKKEIILNDFKICNYFYGEAFPSNEEIVFYRRFGFNEVDCIHNYNIDFALKYKNVNDLKSKNVKAINFEIEELNYIYEKFKFTDNFDFDFDKFSTTGEMSVKINGYDETDSDEYQIEIAGKKMKSHIIVSRGYNPTKLSPVELKIFFRIEYDFNSDYELMYETILFVKNLFSYLSYRKNISINSITTSTKNNNNKYVNNGSIDFELNKLIMDKPDEDYLSKHFILFDSIKDNFDVIFQNIIDGNIYTRNIPNSQIEKNIITPSTIIMITSTFEYEYKLKYKLDHKQKTLLMREKFLELLENLEKKENFNSNEKREWNQLKQSIFFDNLSSKIIHILNKYSQIIDPIAQKIYAYNDKKYSKSQMATAIEKIRNDIAHGNVKIEYNYNEVLGIIVLERLLYVMQLKRCGSTDDNIKSFLFRMFG